jgi:hypothetical protein
VKRIVVRSTVVVVDNVVAVDIAGWAAYDYYVVVGDKDCREPAAAAVPAAAVAALAVVHVDS